MPESHAYIELLRLEQKLDSVLMRKRLDIQETLKRPQKVRLISCGVFLILSFHSD